MYGRWRHVPVGRQRNGCTDSLKIITPTEEETQAEETAKAVDTETTERAANFSFTKCQIPVGEEIEHAYDPSLKAKVVGDRAPNSTA